MKIPIEYKTILIACFIWITSSSLNAQTWERLNTVPTLVELEDVYFKNANNGWVVGESGVILRTTDAGISWEIQNSGTTSVLEKIHFLNANRGLIFGGGGTILETVDGGNSWKNQPVDATSTQALWKMYFVNANRGWVVGNEGTILKTIDGGNSWQSQNSGTTESLWYVHFIDEIRGWIVGSGGTILKTVNGGDSWESQHSGITEPLSYIYFVDADRGWIIGNGGTILATTNGGDSWGRQNSGVSSYLKDIHFIDESNGWVVGFSLGGLFIDDVDGVILRTTNGGNSWERQNPDMIGNLWEDIHFIDGNRGWIVGSGGTILATTNGGDSWELQNSGTTMWLRDSYFVDANKGWVVGNGGTILRTIDGGKSWEPQKSGISESLGDIHFEDGNRGWVLGIDGALLITTDGGNSWEPQNSRTTESFSDIHFVDANKGWIVGGNGTILKTTDGGIYWEPQNSGYIKILVDIHFIDQYKGWRLGSRGTILTTTNGGISWAQQNAIKINNTISSWTGIHFIDENRGWAVGDNGTIVTTTDGGNSWEPQNSGISESLYDIHFVDDTTSWVVGLNGTILKTTNGGNSWETQYSGSKKAFYDVHFVNADRGWIVGSDGIMLITIDGGSSWSLQQLASSEALNGIFFLNTDKGWAVGNSGTILSYGRIYANVSDSLNLIAIHNSTDGPNWINSWDIEEPVYTWAGVGLNINGRVDSLDLAANGLKGELPTEFENLTGLISVNLDSNALSGTIPLATTQLEQLQYFSAIENEFTVLPEIQLDSQTLQHINIRQNRLTFEDLIPNSQFFRDVRDYNPQKPFVDTSITFHPCDEPILKIDEDKDFEKLVIWEKIDSNTSNNIIEIGVDSFYFDEPDFESIQGNYLCRITTDSLDLELVGLFNVNTTYDRIKTYTKYVNDTLDWGRRKEVNGTWYDCLYPSGVEEIFTPDATDCDTTIIVQLECKEPILNSDTAISFTPNGDAYNEYFVIPSLENARCTLKILARYGGAPLFTAINYQNDWNGTDGSGKPLPDGTYYYELTCEGDIPVEGNVTIRRR